VTRPAADHRVIFGLRLVAAVSVLVALLVWSCSSAVGAAATYAYDGAPHNAPTRVVDRASGSLERGSETRASTATTATSALIASVVAAEEGSSLVEGSVAERILYHYTDEAGRAGIEASGQINPGAGSGKVFVSPTQYADAATAQAELSLPRPPTAGYFEIPESRLPGLTDPSPVRADYGQPGGGLECWVTCPVDLRGLKFVPWAP
jgi:hypothetical protein